MTSRRPRRGAWALAACLALAATPAVAQIIPEIDADQPVALVADSVLYDSTTGELTAEGSVEVYYGPRTLTADRIVYDDTTGRIRAEGDIVLRDETGTTIFADLADLDAELRDGLIDGAKALLDANTRLSAVEGQRVDDRYNVLSKVAYSPCRICEDDPTPLWRIRARRVIHDQEDRVIHYESARLEFFGIPLLWTPYFSHPDPTVDRASGFLAPGFSTSSNYGYAIEVPYYFVIDDQTDLTVTPFVSTNDGLLGQIEFRRAFDAGALRFEGSLTRADFTGENELHGSVDTAGRFRYGRRTNWGWDIEFASDDDYLRYFDFSNDDRLVSELYVDRYAERSFFDISGVRFQSLRDNEPAGQIPLVLPEFDGRYALDDPFLGGVFGLNASAQGLYRNNGEDSGRISFGADWEREGVLDFGLVVKGFGELRGDMFLVGDTPEPQQDIIGRFVPRAGIELRYPLIAESRWDDTTTISHVLEPIAQAIIAPYGGNDDDIPNEDSLDTEFDETGLFDRTHFSGLDRVEEGPRFNLGLRYALLSGGPIGFDATVGRVLRLRDADEFTEGSGLSGAQSDWVTSWSASYDPYVTVRQRLRLGSDDLEINRNSVAVDLRYSIVNASAEYVFFGSEPETGSASDREEITARAGLQITDNWFLNGFMRRDLELGEFVSVGGGLQFRNECCSIGAFVRREFTDTENVAGSTSVGLQVELLTLGGGGANLGTAGFGDR